MKIPLLFFILIYFNQGIANLPDSALYYLVRETWHTSATAMGLLGFLCSIPWCIKPLFGILVDFFPIKGYRAKNYLILNALGLLLSYLYIITFGLNFTSLIITGFLINCFLGLNDVANDSQMVILEQKYKLQGRLQAVQWTASGVAGLIVSLAGAWIASNLPEPLNYKVAYGLAMIVPALTLIYLTRAYSEAPSLKNRHPSEIFPVLKSLFNKKYLIPLSFIALYQLSPSFGTPLMIHAREVMGIDKMFFGYMGAAGGISALLGYLLYYKKIHKIDLTKLLYFTIISSVVVNLFYLYIPSKWFLLGYSIAFGVLGGITLLTLLAFYARLIPKGSEGMMYALITSISNFFGNSSGWLGGIIYDHSNYATTVIVSTLTTLCCLFFIPKLKENL